MAATMDSSLRTSWPTVAGESQLSVSNADEGYELNGLLNVRHTECKSVWILCHGLCSSLHGTVSRFVSEKLDANTFRQVERCLRGLNAPFFCRCARSPCVVPVKVCANQSCEGAHLAESLLLAESV